ncbi:unnamed protein product [Vitrella brassicaformis CCMP3155]|uniref:N-acetyltransferase domain-containing protein n=1 Tax=Vitrella brassicaformis (strain CCMP3155) TaxID=1169540 RepID=A0A0G4ECM7_VITBC|nr:unnamed protein product [Vitrella brassicaformis CCMP3155]|mmetsp:Transcript_3470/g.7874  ORF Transcript_3470/g.7874 Transcript_3470/m.7874 type:complete len:264 (-) Transcript_3470:1025-1816(-)|eukprot:CEL93297.1 unnamed protein product [Vitrella brassicaformis CCMP3155]
MDLFDLRDLAGESPDVAIHWTRRFYSEVLRPSFDDDLLDDLADIEKGLLHPDVVSPELHVLVAAAGGECVAGGSLFEYYSWSNCGLSSYTVVLEPYRGEGLARRILDTRNQILDAARRRFGYHEEPCTLFAEIADAPGTRQQIQHKLGWRPLRFKYVQPPLSESKNPVEGLLLAVNGRQTLDRHTVQRFLIDYAASVDHTVLAWAERRLGIRLGDVRHAVGAPRQEACTLMQSILRENLPEYLTRQLLELDTLELVQCGTFST